MVTISTNPYNTIHITSHVINTLHHKVCACACVCICACSMCIRAYMHVRVCVSMYTCIYACVYVHIIMCMHMCMHMCMCICLYVCRNDETKIFIYKHILMTVRPYVN